MKDGVYIYPKGNNNIRDQNEEKYYLFTSLKNK